MAPPLIESDSLRLISSPEKAIAAAIRRSPLWTFTQLATLTKAVALQNAVSVATSVAGRGFNRHCNLETAKILRRLQANGEIADLSEAAVDYGDVRAVYEQGIYDSRRTQLEVGEMARALLMDYDILNKRDQSLFVEPESKALIQICHEERGRSEFCSSKLAASSLLLRWALSPDTRVRKIAATWNLKEAARSIDEYVERYEGDAEVTIESQQVAICGPFFPDIHLRMRSAQTFLENFADRMAGRPYLLCSVLGFQQWRKKHARDEPVTWSPFLQADAPEVREEDPLWQWK